MNGQIGSKRLEWMTKHFLCFVAFGMIGWIYEVAVMYFEMHMGYVNRGFLYGPCLPIYGFGGSLIILLFGGLKKRGWKVWKMDLMPFVCFCGICAMATALELFASYLLERLVGHSLWDYRGTGFGPTFEGRIALGSSLRFGVIGIGVLYGVYPLLEKGLRSFRKKFPQGYWMAASLIAACFMIDLLYHVIYGSNANW